MGRKSSSKGQAPARPREPHAKRSNALIIGVVIAALAGIGSVMLWRSAGGNANVQNKPAAKSAEPTPEIVAKVEAAAKAGPRKQANLPPIPFQAYAPPRPVDVITAAYQFAAEHPEVLGYVPCFCGCENGGHTGNHDCFVKTRGANGDVVEWDEHGVECTVCIDVANRSRQLHAGGASVAQIRTAIEKEFAALYQGRTPTPHPASHATH